MAQKIRILPENLANQIAAGEVVERPASVVKELVENALDASASEIFIDIEKGGRTLVQVADNGCGMSQDDAFLCLERHATSKISTDRDLFALHTMGFRGEALPAIASVARMRLTTRSLDHESGWQIYAEGGKIRQADAIGAPAGTIVEVRDLFFNTPGRRKFLRKDETEFGHIADVVTRIALARPDVHVRLNRDGRTFLDAYRHQSLEERVSALLGRSLSKDMLPIEADSGNGELLFGLLGAPGLSRSSTGQLYTYVNGRFVRDRTLQHAVLDAYRSLLEKRRYPVAVLFLDLPPEKVDVNVHPTKHEVRFREQRQVHDFISGAVRRRLHDVNPVGRSGPLINQGAADTVKPTTPSSPVTAAPDYQERVQESLQTYARDLDSAGHATADTVKREALSMPSKDAESDVLPDAWRLIGQYLNSYLICQFGDELVLVDQHAAHERIGFERLKAELQKGRLESQSLLFPEVIELEHREASQVAEVLERFGRFGFELEHFGGRTFTVKAVPQILAGADVERLIRDVATELTDVGQSEEVDSAVENVLKLLACHGMVRAGQALSSAEMRTLLKDLAQIGFGACCPHGRPVVKRLSRADVERFFHRL